MTRPARRPARRQRASLIGGRHLRATSRRPRRSPPRGARIVAANAPRRADRDDPGQTTDLGRCVGPSRLEGVVRCDPGQGRADDPDVAAGRRRDPPIEQGRDDRSRPPRSQSVVVGRAASGWSDAARPWNEPSGQSWTRSPSPGTGTPADAPFPVDRPAVGAAPVGEASTRRLDPERASQAVGRADGGRRRPRAACRSRSASRAGSPRVSRPSRA